MRGCALALQFRGGKSLIAGQQPAVTERAAAIQKSAAQNVLVEKAQQRSGGEEIAQVLEGAAALERGAGPRAPQQTGGPVGFLQDLLRFLPGVAAVLRLPL